MIEKPKIVIFDSGIDGPVLLFFGAIHGNEICGPFAIDKIIDEIESGRIVVKKGKAIFVPVCNVRAFEKNQMLIEENLNRVFRVWESADSYEKGLANFLTSLLEQCDFLLDLHSTESDGESMVFVDYPTKELEDFVRILGAKYGVMGWQELYKNKGRGIISYDTVGFAKEKGTDAVVLECGQHQDPKAKEIAYNAIVNTLRYFGVIDGEPDEFKEINKVYMEDLFVRESEDDKFARDWANFDKIKKGEVLFIRANGQEVRAIEDYVLIMPNANSGIGEEWFYLGKKK